jgi:hypothetical protein
MFSKKVSILVGVGMLLGALSFIILFAWPKYRVKEVSKELDNDLRMASVTDRVLSATFEALKQFKNENGHLPSEDNQSTVVALLGKNKTGKNYIPDWNPNVFDNKGRLLDTKDESLVFHFINDNEITIYSSGTQQQLHGFLDTDKVTISDPSQ